jgi:hypothetical protein
MDDLSTLKKEIISQTVRNRNETMKELNEYDSKTLVLILIETMKKYSQNEDCLTGQYMMFLDAVQSVLTERKFIGRIRTWTLEDFLAEIPFFSEVVEAGF